MPRWLLVALAVLPACPPPWMEPGSTTGESTGMNASTGVDSTGAGSSSSSDGSGDQSSSKTGSDSASSDTGETSTSDATSASTTGTTGDPPFCGDGVVDPGEECDDGDIDMTNGCTVICARDRVIFVSSEEFTPEDLGGLYYADGICRQLAGKAGLANSKTFTAWLSDSKASAASRIFPSKGRYVRPDGVLIARDVEQLASGQLEAPINVTEWSMTIQGTAWTGTLPNGDAVPGAQHCNDWTSDSDLDLGHYGYVGASDSAWTLEPNPDVNPTLCGSYAHVYCVEGA